MLKNGIIASHNITPDYIETISALEQNYKITDDDNEITRVFKALIINGNMKDTVNYLDMKPDKVSDILFYKQTEDINLTLLAKAVYMVSGTKYKDFLKWQIDVILKEGNIDIKEQYIKWKLADGWTIEEINNNIDHDKF